MKNGLCLLLSGCLCLTSGAMAASSGGGMSSGMGSGSGSTSTSSTGTSTSGGGFSEDNPPQDVTNKIDDTWLCVRWMVVGICYPTDLMIVSHYLPVAYITTPKKKDDSKGSSTSTSSSSGTSSSGSSSSGGTGSGSGEPSAGSLTSATSGIGGTRVRDGVGERSMAWEAIVWEITQDERDDALESWDGCLCELSEDNQSGGGSSGTSSSSSSSGTSGVCDSYGSDSSSTGGASGSSSSSSGSSGGGEGGGGGGQGSDDREVYYNSGKDGNNWSTGCRDLNVGGSDNDSGGGTGSMGGFSMGSGDMMNCAAMSTEEITNENCIGAWGAMKPRYMWTAGTTELISSAKIAFRAAHLAAEVGEMPYTVGKMNGIIQQADPKKTFCFNIGSTPLIVDAMARVSQDGQYAWIYWKKVGCCKEISDCSGGS